MDSQMVTTMLGLVDTLARKDSFKGPELTCYLRGLTFVENYFELSALMIEKELRKVKDEDENAPRDTERVSR